MSASFGYGTDRRNKYYGGSTIDGVPIFYNDAEQASVSRQFFLAAEKDEAERRGIDTEWLDYEDWHNRLVEARAREKRKKNPRTGEVQLAYFIIIIYIIIFAIFLGWLIG